MSTRLRVVLAAAALIVPVTSPAQTSIEQLTWLAGCWAGDANGRTVDEHWMKPSGGTMLGMSRTVAAGKTIEFEFLQIRQTGTEIAYIARPANQAEASFVLTSAGPNEARFENPKHDFPQRIIYRLNAGGALHARIEGVMQGKERGIDFPMKRSICP